MGESKQCPAGATESSAATTASGPKPRRSPTREPSSVVLTLLAFNVSPLRHVRFRVELADSQVALDELLRHTLKLGYRILRRKWSLESHPVAYLDLLEFDE